MEKANTSTRHIVQGGDRTHFTLPPWGFIETIELRPRVDAPNMDASCPYTLVVDLYGPDGARVPLDVQLVARDVKEGAR